MPIIEPGRPPVKRVSGLSLTKRSDPFTINANMNKKIAFAVVSSLLVAITLYVGMNLYQHLWLKTLTKAITIYFLIGSTFLYIRKPLLSRECSRDEVSLFAGLLAFSGTDISIDYNVIVGGVFALLGVILYSASFFFIKTDVRRARKIQRFIAVFALVSIAFAGLAVAAIALWGSGVDRGTLVLFAVYMSSFAALIASSFVSPVPRILPIAMILFYVSDIVVSFDNVVKNDVNLTLLNGLFYYPAQILVAYSLSFRKERR
jgi:hypothetical protein